MEKSLPKFPKTFAMKTVRAVPKYGIGFARIIVRLFACVLLWLIGVVGCRTIPPSPTIDLREPGWTTQLGEATWKRDEAAEILAVEILLARRGTNLTFLQVSKGGLPLFEVTLANGLWNIRSSDGQKSYGGQGNPPVQAGPGQLAQVLAGLPLTRGWEGVLAGESIRLSCPRTGEEWEVFMTP